MLNMSNFYSLSWSSRLSLSPCTLRKHGNMIEFTHLFGCPESERCWDGIKKKRKDVCDHERHSDRDYLKCNLSVSVPMQWQFFDFNLLFSKSPKPFFILFFPQKHRLRNVQTTAMPAGRLSSYLWFHLFYFAETSQWMWSDFSWNHFCFDAGKGGRRRSDIAQNLHIKTS